MAAGAVWVEPAMRRGAFITRPVATAGSLAAGAEQSKLWRTGFLACRERRFARLGASFVLADELTG